MRLSMFQCIASLAFLALGCSGEPLTGVEAQAAYAAASSQLSKLPAGAVVLVDGVVIVNRAEFDLDPEEIVRIEVIKGPAAERLYGDSATAGVIQIFTTRSTDSTANGHRP